MNYKPHSSKLRRSESYKENLESSDKLFWKPFVFLPTKRSWSQKAGNEINRKRWTLELNRNIIGEDESFNGPFGVRKAIYFDYTASGRSIRSIEKFIREQVLPVYGNTHTSTSFFASEISAYREEAREIIHTACGGGINDEVIFCGSGATSAIHKLVHSIQCPGDQPPVIITGPFEHHSNILPWKELSKKIIMIPEDSYGRLDMTYLQHTLSKISSKRSFIGKKRQILGVFSASSNVTGALTDDVAVTALMHSHGGLAIWDYAAAAPHVKISMNPVTQNKELDVLVQKDAIFFSGHKFLGGPQTPGVLIAKRHIFRNPVPHGIGGGTVLFVTKHSHQYLKATHEREEGGTPDIVGSIRLGLVFQLKNQVSDEMIMSLEAYYAVRVLEEWRKLPELVILGNKENPRIPIVSFMVKHLPSGYFLHHDFVVALLNDLFGIQCRGGCMCAGPYAHNLLGINDSLALAYETIVTKPKNSPDPFREPQYDLIFRPGFARVSIPYHASMDEVHYLIDAVKFVAVHGWKLLPMYKCSFEEGTFRCKGFNALGAQKPQRKLESIRLINLDGEHSERTHRFTINKQSSNCFNFKESLEFAETSLLENIHKVLMSESLEDDTKHVLPKRKHLRWFLLPSEALQYFKDFRTNTSNRAQTIPTTLPFSPAENYKSINSGNNLRKTFIPGSIPYMISSTDKWDPPIDSTNLGNEATKLREITQLFKKSLISSRTTRNTETPHSTRDFDEQDEQFDNDGLLPESPTSDPSSGFHEVNFRGSSYF